MNNFIKKYILKIKRKYKPRYGLSDNDIILATFPKSGTTWIRFILANIISIEELGGITIDYHILNNKLRASFEDNNFPIINYSCLPIIWNTHRPYKSTMFGNNLSIYLYRNVGDVMVSYFKHRKGLKGFREYRGNFKEFIKDKNYGIEAWCNHIISWLPNANVLITYEELKNNPFISIKRTLLKLNIQNIRDETIIKSIERSQFDKIKKLEIERGLDIKSKSRHKKGFIFARKGVVGDYESYFDLEDITYMNSILEKYNLTSLLKKLNIPKI